MSKHERQPHWTNDIIKELCEQFPQPDLFVRRIGEGIVVDTRGTSITQQQIIDYMEEIGLKKRGSLDEQESYWERFTE